jgi:signal transduction histidine kinase
MKQAITFFQDLRVRCKLLLLMMLTTLVTLVLACAALLIYEQATFRSSMIRDLSITAELTAANTGAEMDFEDASGATNVLASLGAQPHIRRATMYKLDGTAFADYRRAEDSKSTGPAPSLEPGYRFGPDQLIVVCPIVYNKVRSGTLLLESDLQALRERLRRFGFIVGLVLLASTLVAYLLASRLQGLISRPILQLANTTAQVAVERDYSLRAEKQGNDELGQLIEGFNEMLAQIERQNTSLQQARDQLEERVEERTQELKQAHQELLETSRQAGMAEVATSVLHNVGNVLNSVNVSGGILVDTLQQSKIPHLAKVSALLEEHANDLGHFLTEDTKGSHVPKFLGHLARHLEGEREQMLNEVESLKKNIDHIKEIVAVQQGYAKAAGLAETFYATDLVEDALRINAGGLRQSRIEVAREYCPDTPQLVLDRHKALQILVNLISNARHACSAAQAEVKRLTLRVGATDGLVEVTVMDNGVGIAPENLTRIFSHGFTTRKDGHGFGLHSGALAAQELGGTLRVYSAGVGKGATFTLVLPVKEAEG